MTGVLPLEPHVDDMIQYLCQRLEEKFIDGPNANKICDLGEWISFCKFCLLVLQHLFIS